MYKSHTLFCYWGVRGFLFYFSINKTTRTNTSWHSKWLFFFLCFVIIHERAFLVMSHFIVNISNSKTNKKKTHLAFAVQRTNRQAIRFPLLDRTKNDSNNSFSRSPYCQSAFSSRVILNLVLLVSSAFKSYEHSGGRKANFDATKWIFH